MEIPINASKIDLSNQNLDYFPKEVFLCKNLQKLILRNNRIRIIPKEIAKLKRLKMIDLSNNKIEILYAKLFSLTNLEEIYLNQNSIKAIPPQISNLKQLRKISLSRNKLKSLPEEIALLANLEFLNISSNPIDEFPMVILNLRNLKSLRISNVNLKSFPAQNINDKLINIKSLYCYSIHINKFKTDETNRDYLFLAAYRGNCIQRLKELIKLSSETSPLQVKPQIKEIKGSSSGRVTTKEKLHSKDFSERNQIFICYSHADEVWRKKVETAIKSMEFEGFTLVVWSDTKIRTSTRWRKEIFNALSKSRIAILLVSNDFLASEFIQKQELPRILGKAKNDNLRIMSIIISYCRYSENKSLSQYQSLNPPDTPLLSMGRDKQDLYLYYLTKEIEYYIDKN